MNRRLHNTLFIAVALAAALALLSGCLPGAQFPLPQQPVSTEPAPAEPTPAEAAPTEPAVAPEPTLAASQAEPVAGLSIEGPEWLLVGLGETALAAGSEATLLLEGGQGSGTTGCNRFAGAYELGENGALQFGPLVMTQMACDGVMEQEQALMAALDATAAYTLEGEALNLADASGAVVATFQARTAATLTGVMWTATGINNGRGAVTGVVEGVDVLAMFLSDGTLAGNSGCNQYNATYTVDGDKLTISPPISTKMACADQAILDQEMAYLNALPQAATYRIQGETMEIRDATGALLVSYRAGPAPITPGQPPATPGAVTPPTPDAGLPALVGTEWGLYRLGGVPPVPDSDAFLLLGEDGSVSGSTGCNRFSGSYEGGTAGVLSFGPLAMTKMACGPALNAQETAFLQALAATAGFNVFESMLTLEDASDAPLAAFTVRESATLSGTTWVATGINNGRGGVETTATTGLTNATFSDDGVMGGSAGCNSYSAGFTVDGDKITIEQPISTMKLCEDPEVMNQEAAYLKALPQAATYRIDGDALELRDSGGALLVRFAAEVAEEAPAQPGAAGEGEMPSAVGTSWQLATLGDAEAAPGGDAILTLGEDGVANGSTGCNNFTGSYTGGASGELSFGPFAMTRKSCDDALNAQEQAFTQALEATAGFSLSAGVMTLADATGAPLATFTVRESAGLVNTNWRATGINNGRGAVQGAFGGVTALFLEDGSLSGQSGCNSYNATYTVDGDKITITPPASTRMACRDTLLQDQEAAYLAVLPQAATYSIDGDTLELRDATGALLVQYRAAGD